MDKVEKAIKYLSERKDIIKYLERKGYKDDVVEGLRAQDCPVARYLSAVTKKDIRVYGSFIQDQSSGKIYTTPERLDEAIFEIDRVHS